MRVGEKMEKTFSTHIASLALKSVLYEVSTSPKPGLVDRFTSGAHTDMDFFTFMSSSSALSKGFHDICDYSRGFKGRPAELLDGIRPIGIEMEKSMFKATEGVNTHKGIVFSLGLVVAAAVQVNKKETCTPEAIAEYVKVMTEGLTQELTQRKNHEILTQLSNGEKIYETYGFKGIRGEVEAGFPTVLKTGLDALRNSYYTFDCKNKLFIQTLFVLMTVCEDSNIISRHDPETLFEVQAMAKDFIESGGMHQGDGLTQVEEMNRLFTQRHISPGGSADLLAVTIFFGLLENIIS